ncbi:MAG: CapA family protein [Trichloromonas sp.]|jgi:poly-gamma-glutamate synthesis protein (capsule biosynthesis protein)|nr:CapA family protein [Trichloromonas sp.]
MINVFITGDFHAGGRIENLLNEERYDNIFGDLVTTIKESDLSLTNLESPLIENGTPIQKTGPSKKSSPKTVRALKFAGFQLITLANNHIMDYGVEGLEKSMNLLNSYSLSYVGVGMNYDEASVPFCTEINGAKLCVINIADNEFSTTCGNYPGANPLNPVENYRSILSAKKNADHVIVVVHGGHENYNLPSPRIKQLFRFFAEAGASAVIGHHTHCYSGYEVYNGIPIFYSLGNFIFDRPGRVKSKWNYGLAVLLRLRKETEFEIIPYNQCGEKPGIEFLTDAEKNLFNKDINKLNSIIMDDSLLTSQFNNYCKNVRNLYSSYLEPHSMNILHYLRNRNFIPSLLSRRKKLLYLNLIRCEAHRDVLMSLLQNNLLREDEA